MLKIKRTVGSKGQVVIPKDIREEFNIKPNTKVAFSIEGNRIILEVEKDPENFVKSFCTTGKKLKRKIDIKRVLRERYDLP